MNEEQKRWMVQGEAVSTGALSGLLATTPEIQVVRRIASDIVVITATESAVNRLKAEFMNLSVVPDEFLEAFIS
jgi:hypothetical protein